MVKEIVGYFSLNYYLVSNSSVGDELKTKVLPHLQARYLPVTLIEKEFGNLVYLSQPDEDFLVVEEEMLQPMYVILTFITFIFLFLV